MSAAESFDYVVVGAGAAGCVLAYRLAMESEASVLVLESGPADDDPALRQPAAWMTLLGSAVDWDYRTVPQRSAAGRVLQWPRGRVVGGSTSINTMVFMRGHRSDYDAWEAAGNPGWGYADTLEAFKAIENFAGEPREFRGTAGPQRVAIPDVRSEFAEAVYQAAVEWGAPERADFNDGAAEGVGWNQLTVSGKDRHSAATAFLRPALASGRVTLRTNAHVTRLNLDGGSLVQTVDYLDHGKPASCRVGQEVFLTAGSIETPKLLMLSGIGPENQLRSHGLPVLVRLDGVGANLQDHPGVPVVFESAAPVPFGPNQGSELGLFCRSGPSVRVPDLQFGVLNLAVASDPAALRTAQAFTFYPSVLKPRSRGTVRLAADSPLSHPLIDPGYLTDSADVDALVRAVEISRELAGMPTLRSWTRAEILPGLGTSDELRDYVRQSVNTWFHPIGTCRMGSDEGGVVDERLRVHGVANLRVADASVMPEIIAANTAAPTMMIAWRAAGWALPA